MWVLNLHAHVSGKIGQSNPTVMLRYIFSLWFPTTLSRATQNGCMGIGLYLFLSPRSFIFSMQVWTGRLSSVCICVFLPSQIKRGTFQILGAAKLLYRDLMNHYWHAACASTQTHIQIRACTHSVTFRIHFQDCIPCTQSRACLSLQCEIKIARVPLSFHPTLEFTSNGPNI